MSIAINAAERAVLNTLTGADDEERRESARASVAEAAPGVEQEFGSLQQVLSTDPEEVEISPTLAALLGTKMAHPMFQLIAMMAGLEDDAVQGVWEKTRSVVIGYIVSEPDDDKALQTLVGDGHNVPEEDREQYFADAREGLAALREQAREDNSTVQA